MTLKPWLIATLAVAFAQPAYAQLAPHNDAGVTFGHVHLSVADPKVHHQLWVEQFGGVVATKGTFTIVKLPNMMIAFRGTKPTGGTETTAMNHFGLKVPSMANAIAKWKAAGYEVQREFKGSEGFPNAFLIGPDGLRFELQEDTTLKAPAVAYHLHFMVPEPAKLRDGLIPLGITLISAGSHTEPGGYTGAGKEKIHRTERGRIVELASGSSEWAPAADRATNATGQFEIADGRSPQEISALLRRLGYEPVWKDWDAALTV